MSTFGTISNIGWGSCSNVSIDYCNAWINSDTSDCSAGRLIGVTSTPVRIDPWEDDDIGEEEEREMCTYREAGHRRSLKFWRDRYNLKYR